MPYCWLIINSYNLLNSYVTKQFKNRDFDPGEQKRNSEPWLLYLLEGAAAKAQAGREVWPHDQLRPARPGARIHGSFSLPSMW